MESGWIINYEDGRRVIMNEAAYNFFKGEGKVSSEEHWFDMKKAEERYPEIGIVVM